MRNRVCVRGAISAALLALQAAVWAAGAAADPGATYWPPQSDPSSNYAVGPNALPFDCLTSGTSPGCINAGVYYLDQARQRLGQPPYKLPADFPRLSAAEQAFVLTNLDREIYALPPIAGLTSGLDQDAQESGVLTDTDPVATDPNFQNYGSNQAGPFENMVLAYEAWMYDDGYGSHNIDCTSAGSAGCWVHRHDVLFEITDPGPTAMGAAVGKDTHGTLGYAMLLGGGTSSYSPSYIYTWRQALQTGAGTHTYAVSRPATAKLGVRLGLIGRVLMITIRPPARQRSIGSHLRCSLVRQSGSRFPADRFHSCGKFAVFRNVKPGTYQFDVTSSIGWSRSDWTIS